MLNYIRAELYKVTHRVYLYITLGVLLGLAGLLVWAWWFSNRNGNFIDLYTAGGILVMVLNVGLYFTVLTGDMVFSEQYKHNTLKNEVSYGLPRARIYWGKLIVQCLVSLVLCAVLVIFYVGLCWLVLPGGERAGELLRMLGGSLLCALPLWLGAQALSNAVYFNLKNGTIAAGLVAAFLVTGHQLVKLLGVLVSDVFHKLYQFMLVSPFERISEALPWDWGLLGSCLLVGALWFAGSAVVGLLLFRRKEIN